MLYISFGLTGGLRPKPGLFRSRDETYSLKLLVLDHLLHFDTAQFIELPTNQFQIRATHFHGNVSRRPFTMLSGSQGELQMVFTGINLVTSVVRRTGDEIVVAVS